MENKLKLKDFNHLIEKYRLKNSKFRYPLLDDAFSELEFQNQEYWSHQHHEMNKWTVSHHQLKNIFWQIKDDMCRLSVE